MDHDYGSFRSTSVQYFMFVAVRYAGYFLFNTSLPCELEITLEVAHEHFPRFALHDVVDLVVVEESGAEDGFAGGVSEFFLLFLD